MLRRLPRRGLQWKKAGWKIGKAGVGARELSVSEPTALWEGDIVLPDVLTELQDRTQLTRKTIARILTESRRLNDFKRIRSSSSKWPPMHQPLQASGPGRWHQVPASGEEHYYAQELFETEELTGYLRNLVLDTRKSVLLSTSSMTPASSVTSPRPWSNGRSRCKPSCRVGSRCRLRWKLQPRLGGGGRAERPERLYFVVETKSSLFDEDHVTARAVKIKYGAQRISPR